MLVLRNTGPKGGPGMPEWGQLPIPERLLRRGVDDIVRISDARMSGTAFGTVVLHVSPESAVGGPLLAVRDGDPIVLDVEAGRLDLDLPPGEIERRLDATAAAAAAVRPGLRRALPRSTSARPTRAATSTCSAATAPTPEDRRSASCAAGSAAGDGASGSDASERRAVR